ncbi:MAG: nickel pincer cofactor biosynthesis protein LarC [candidate division NC10 bacterium]|nr:nickel pincer cofactor biosynthesis protein LarC [candidate division NC10 bacterium]
MKIAYFDCFSGASGDMILGALVDSGLSLEALRAALASLKLTGIDVKAQRVKKGGLVGTKVDVLTPPGWPHHRHLSDIVEIIDKSGLDQNVKEDAKGIFQRLATAEAKVHGTDIQEVHFHEVGAFDAIADIVGSAFGIRQLGVERLYASPLNLGSGVVNTSHGRLPVPAPGTAELLKGVPVYSNGIEGELTTPTGVAILSTLVAGFGPLPQMAIERIGYGAGMKELAEQPNLLRLLVGKAKEIFEEDRIAVLEANIDDMSPQFFEPLLEHLFQEGALDVFMTPIIMKKSRPAVKLTILADPHLADACSAIILRETTSFGVRIQEAERRKLRREIIEVQTRFGPIRVKGGYAGEGLLILSPEYEDCKQIALSKQVPIREVYEEAKRAAKEQGLGTGDSQENPDFSRTPNP